MHTHRQHAQFASPCGSTLSTLLLPLLHPNNFLAEWYVRTSMHAAMVDNPNSRNSRNMMPVSEWLKIVTDVIPVMTRD